MSADGRAAERPHPTPLPCLLYLGDVPVRDALGSLVLLYRLLERYPAERLRVIETNLWPASKAGRLRDVRYSRQTLGAGRLMTTRLVGAYSSFMYVSAPLRGHAAALQHRRWRPEAVLTVAIGSSWRAAARMARDLRVPVHLIMHDDPPGFFGLSGPLRDRADRDFGAAYRQAASRLCICPGMAERFADRYDAPAEVLYPLRSPNAPTYSSTPVARCGAFTLAYSGDIHHAGAARDLAAAARVLETAGGRLLVFSSAEGARRLQNEQPGGNVAIRPTLLAGVNVDRLRTEADALLLPMTFDERSLNVEVSFPSKIVDYTATGLPMVVWAPERSSAVRWVREAGGAGEIVTDSDPEALLVPVQRLARDPALRAELGARALHAGNRMFSHDVVVSRFYAALTR